MNPIDLKSCLVCMEMLVPGVSHELRCHFETSLECTSGGRAYNHVFLYRRILIG